MKVIQILNIILFLKLTFSAIVIDPICYRCLIIDQSLIQPHLKPQFNVNLTLFKLPGFSQSKIYVDFRHLKQIPKINNNSIFKLIFQITDAQSGQVNINNVNDTIIGTNQYTLAAMQDTYLVIFFLIDDQYKAFQYLLRDAVSLKLSYSNNRLPYQQSSYLFFIQSQDNINLPKNKPDLNNIKNFYLQNQRIDSDLMGIQNDMESTTYWSTEDHFYIPYFPYFSNCQGQGNLMQITQLLQNQKDCSLVPVQQTGWISQFSFGSSAHADNCISKRKCTLVGNVQKTEYPQWQTLPKTITLFSISKEKIDWKRYTYNMDLGDQDLVGCIIKSSSGQNSSSSYPLRVRMTLGYYQVSEIQKRIITCSIDYDLYVPSTQNFQYQLQIKTYPLNHTYIMLNFGFKWYVYMIVFLIIGLVGNIENLLLWIYHYFVAQERKQIKITMYLKIIKELLKGTLLALALITIIIFIVCIIMNGKIFATTIYQKSIDNTSATPRVFWDYVLEDEVNNYDSDQMKNLRAGRMGLAFVTIGVMVILLNCHFFIGKQKKKQQYKQFSILGRLFKPLEWNRGKFLFGTFFFIALQFFFIYFAYSTLYSQNIWTFIVLMKVLQVIMQQITNSIFGDILPGLPLKIITDITSYLNTISAADLYDFLFGSLIDVAITMIQKIYIFQIQNMVVEKIQQKIQEINKFYLNLMNEEDGDDQNESNYAGNQQNNSFMLQNQEHNNNDNQNVFIYRQAQEVQFLEQQIKEVHTCTREDLDLKLRKQIKIQQSQYDKKKKYFDSLMKDYKRQRQLLFKQKQQKPILKNAPSKKEQKNKSNQNQNNQNAQNQKQENQQKMERQSVIFQLLLDHIAMIYTFIVNPFVVFIFWLTFYESDLLNRYGIVYNTVLLYILSALVIGFFSVLNIIMIFHILESYMGLSFQQQINDILNRFHNRAMYWKADQEELNESVKPQLRGADHYCLSSQLFFILTVYVGGMILVILGMTILFKTSYNCFDDIATIPIVIFWLIVMKVFIQIIKFTAIKIDIWDYHKYYNQSQTLIHQKDSKKMYAIADLNNQFNEISNHSEIKTQNIILSDVEYNTRDIILLENITNSKKTIKNNQSNQSKKDSQDEPFSLKKISKTYIEKKIKKKKNMEIQNLNIKNWDLKDDVALMHKRLQVICKKLQPFFQKQSFKRQYTFSNRQYIKQNIQKILPLVSTLPQLQDFKIMQQQLSANLQHSKKAQQNKMNTDQPTYLKYDYIKQSSQINKSGKNKRHNHSTSSKSKSMDPTMSIILSYWLRQVQKSKMNRINRGLQDQSKLKKCSFCYQTWGLYYGYGGACLQCSIRLMSMKKQKQREEEQRIMQRNQKRISQMIEKGLIKQRKAKIRKLNVIKQQDISQSDEQLVSSQNNQNNDSSQQDDKQYEENRNGNNNRNNYSLMMNINNMSHNNRITKFHQD